MTLDVLHFIDNKGGNAEEIRESQRKRGLSVEIVDEVIQMYTDWVKCKWALTCNPCAQRVQGLRSGYDRSHSQSTIHSHCVAVDFEANSLAKSVNSVQKEIAAKKKVR